ncbi:MAG: PIN domain-containing protein [Deltaproteobacteria bacterium]|nr:PIN domain-containing protein [Deltaproteobacteria bacterium]
MAARKDQGFISVHSIAEVYAALTRLPVQPRIHPAEAARIITDNILPHFETVSVGKKDYIEALRLVGDGGWSGAKIYDALLIGCAARSGADRIYTFQPCRFPAAGTESTRENLRPVIGGAVVVARKPTGERSNNGRRLVMIIGAFVPCRRIVRFFQALAKREK